MYRKILSEFCKVAECRPQKHQHKRCSIQVIVTIVNSKKDAFLRNFLKVKNFLKVTFQNNSKQDLFYKISRQEIERAEEVADLRFDS